jgi:hypothetical protein
LESLLEGVLASALGDGHKWWQTAGHVGLGVLFGPGANNTITIGTTLTLNYMVGKSNNFTVMRGRPEISIKYFYGHFQSDIGQDYTSNELERSRLMWVFIAAFALLIAGFDIALNVLKNTINIEEEKVHKDQDESDTYKNIVEEEQKAAETQGRVVNPDAGGAPVYPSPAQKQLKDAKATTETDKTDLNNTERSYEWTMFSNVFAENRGFLVLKLLEQMYAGVKSIEIEIKDLKQTIANIENNPNQDGANLQEEVANLEKVIEALAKLSALNPSTQLLEDLNAQIARARSLAHEVKKKIENSAAVAVQVASPAEEIASDISSE